MAYLSNIVFAIIALPKHFLDQESKSNEEDYTNLPLGVNGTVFFIDKNKFVTAHHVLNKEYIEDHVHFLVNHNGKIIKNVSIDSECPECDMTIGRVIEDVEYFADVPIDSFEIDKKLNFLASGYSQKSTIGIEVTFKVISKEIYIVGVSSLELEIIPCNYVRQIKIKEHTSSDNNVTLKDCHVFAFDKPLPVGFSGGPIFETTTNKVIALASQQASCSEDNEKFVDIQFSIPICYKAG